MDSQTDHGFTLIEMMVIVVILGILAGAVVFNLNGVVSSGVVSACETNANIVNTAVVAYDAHTGGTPVATPSRLTSSATPYLQNFPSSPDYVISISPSGRVMIAAPATAPPVPFGTAGACSGVAQR